MTVRLPLAFAWLLLVLVAAPTAVAAAPQAQFTWEPVNPQPGEVVEFDASATVDPEGRNITRYFWIIEGHEPVEGNVTHNVTFEEEGVYQVVLQATDEDGETGQVTQFIRVGSPPTRPIFDTSAIFRHFDVLLKGAVITIQLSVLSILMGLPIGVVVALGRLAPNVVVRTLAGVYVEGLRGSPLILQILGWFLVPPVLTDALNARYPWFPIIRFTAFQAGLIALLINTSAYQAEIIRAGIQAIPSAQSEAAMSLGMTKGQAMRHVVLPQAFRLIAPPMTNEFIILLKDTSLVTIIGLTPPELFGTARFIMARTFQVVEILVAVAIIYIAMTYSLSQFLRWLERRYRIPGLGVHGT